MAFMPGHDVDFVALDLAFQSHRRPALDDALPQPSGHVLDITTVEIELLSNLLIRQIQAHEVQAQHPDLQRLMMAGEDGSGEIIEAALTVVAVVPLSMGLGIIPAVLDDVPGVA